MAFDISRLMQPSFVNNTNVKQTNPIGKNSDLNNTSILNLSQEDDSSKTIEEYEQSYQEAAEAVQAQDKAKKTGDEEAVKKADKEAETKGAEATKAEEEVKAANSASETKDVELTEEQQERMDELEEEKAQNEEKMDKLEAQIEDLTESAEANILKAAEAQESAVKDYENESKEVLDKNINEYINANKEGGEGMSRDQLQENIRGALPNNPEIADALAAMTEANEQLNEVDSLLGDLNDLIQDTKGIEQEMDSIQKAAEKAAEEKKCCDPIGFTAGEGADKAQYDFIVDDGNFDSTSDFLGAANQWAAMAALDTDGDKVVTTDELKAGNIKAVKTGADGSQSVVDLADEFGDDFSIDLNSYKEGGSHSAIDTQSDKDNDGVKDQSLLGTFSVNTGDGKKVEGYNTLDDTDFLKEAFGLNASDADDEDSSNFSLELQQHINFFNEYTQKSQDLRDQLNSTYETIGLTDDQINGIDEVTKSEAKDKADNFYNSLKEEEEIEKADSKGETTEEAAAASSQSEKSAPALEEETASTEAPENEDLLEMELLTKKAA